MAKTKLDATALAAAIMDPEQVPDAVLPKLLSALGTSSREDTAQLVQSEPQAAAVAARIVKPLMAKVAAPVSAPKEIEVPTTEAEAEAPLGSKKARVRF
jgi:hypothetical protein